MVRISDLLRWKDWIMLKNKQDVELKKVWLRVIGDEDLSDSYKAARLASAQERKDLKNPESDAYKERVEYLKESSFEDCFEIIASSRAQNIPSEAISNVVRPDLIKIEEIAVDPDAPTLEEQEKLDIENAKLDIEYQNQIAQYIDTRKAEIETEWRDKPLEEVRQQAELEVSALMALSVFFTRLEEEKCWRSVYEDEECKIKGFIDIHDFRAADSLIKEQLMVAYRALESGAR